MKIDNFFAELKRRNVYKVAVAYAVVAWLTIQAASIFLPAFNAPQWAMQIVILILVLGFPIALVFSWAFEITPEGIKRESEMSLTNRSPHRTGRKIVGLHDCAGRGRSRFTGLSICSPEDRHLHFRPAPISNKSIAVLPFDNLKRRSERMPISPKGCRTKF